MMSAAPSAAKETSPRPSIRELPAAALGLVFGILTPIAILASRSQIAFTRPWTKAFWVDEFHTLLLLEEPSLVERLQKLADGADFNPPGLYLLLQVWTLLTGPPTEVSLRVFSSLSVLAALVGIYWMVRQASYSIGVAFVTAYAVWVASPLLMEQAFEARFYAPWLAACVWLCNGLIAMTRRPESWPAIVLTAVSAFFVCTIHYFGAFAIGLIGAFHLAFHGRDLRSWLRFGVPLSVGPIALVCCTPMYLGQKAVLSGDTWVYEANLGNTLWYLREFYLSLVAAFILVLFVGQKLLLRPGPSRPAEPRLLAGPAGLLLMPLVVIVFSFAVQPAMVPRYSLPFLAGLAAVFAVLLGPLRKGLLALAFVGVLVGSFAVSSTALQIRAETLIPDLVTRLARRLPDDIPLVFGDRNTCYIAWRYCPDERDRIRHLVPKTVDNRWVATEAKVSERMKSLHPSLPIIVHPDAVTGKSAFLAAWPLESVAAAFPGMHVRKIDEFRLYSVYVVEPKSGEK